MMKCSLLGAKDYGLYEFDSGLRAFIVKSDRTENCHYAITNGMGKRWESAPGLAWMAHQLSLGEANQEELQNWEISMKNASRSQTWENFISMQTTSPSDFVKSLEGALKYEYTSLSGASQVNQKVQGLMDQCVAHVKREKAQEVIGDLFYVKNPNSVVGGRMLSQPDAIRQLPNLATAIADFHAERIRPALGSVAAIVPPNFDSTHFLSAIDGNLPSDTPTAAQPIPFDEPDYNQVLTMHVPSFDQVRIHLNFAFPSELMQSGAPQYITWLLNHNSEGSMYNVGELASMFVVERADIRQYTGSTSLLELQLMPLSTPDPAKVLTFALSYFEKLRETPVVQGVYQERRALDLIAETVEPVDMHLAAQFAADLSANSGVPNRLAGLHSHHLPVESVTQGSVDTLFTYLTKDKALVNVLSTALTPEFEKIPGTEISYCAMDKQVVFERILTGEDKVTQSLSFTPAEAVPSLIPKLERSDPQPTMHGSGKQTRVWVYKYPTNDCGATCALQFNSKWLNHAWKTPELVSTKWLAMDYVLRSVFDQMLRHGADPIYPRGSLLISKPQQDFPGGVGVIAEGHGDLLLKSVPGLMYVISSIFWTEKYHEGILNSWKLVAKMRLQQSDPMQRTSHILLSYNNHGLSPKEALGFDKFIDEIDSITLEDFQAFAKKVRAEYFPTVALFGNVEDGLLLKERIQQITEGPFFESEEARESLLNELADKTVGPELGPMYVRETVTVPDHYGSMFTTQINIGSTAIEDHATLFVINQVLRSIIPERLRQSSPDIGIFIEDNPGRFEYGSVFCAYTTSQKSSADIDQLEAILNSAIEGELSLLANISQEFLDEALQTIENAVRIQGEIPEVRTKQFQAAILWHNTEFGQHQKLLNAISQVRQSNVQQMAGRLLNTDTRRRIDVRAVPEKPKA